MCRRWRSIVFTSPRRLDLRLFCTTQRSVNSKTLEIWPELPIVIGVYNLLSKVNVTNVIAALRHHNRVCKISLSYRPQQDFPLLKEFATIDEPFPALTALTLSAHGPNVPVLPDSILGGSAPHLRSLYLLGIPYPSIGKLLPSTTNLVELYLWRIPHSGYIAPETIVPCLAALARLESLTLGFRHPRSRETRHPPPLTGVVFPNLTSLHFNGDIEFLEDTLSQIETPVLNQCHFCLFNQVVFDTPLLGYFIHRTKTFMESHARAARVECLYSSIRIGLSEREDMVDDGREIRLEISCKPLDWQLSALAQVLNSFLPSLSTLESLQIEVTHFDWQGEIEAIQWREFLHPFASVNGVTLVHENSVRLVALALQELAGERETEVLPALQNLFLRTYGWQQPSGPVKGAIEQFIATRQLYSHPVTVHYQDI